MTDLVSLLGFDTNYISPWEMLFRLVMAMAAGAIIGIDREFKHKPAGMRAFIIITVSTTAYALASFEMAAGYDPTSDAAVDPSRHIQGILGAFGFLGAGAIIQSRGRLAGIATGASIFAAGAVGTAIGFGIVWLGFVLAILCVLTLKSIEALQHERDDLIERDSAEDMLDPNHKADE